jgi:hypothetical protein
MKNDDFNDLRAARRAGTMDTYLDSLGRREARDSAPRFTELAERAFDLVAPSQPARTGSRERRVNTASQPGLFDASAPLRELIGHLCYLDYEVDGQVYSHDELADHYDAMARLEEIRRREAERAARDEDHARLEKERAFHDANILRVALERLTPSAAAE